MPPILIAGAGITGLTAAWELLRQGREVVVLEASPRPGGAIHTLRQDGWLVEAGPNTLMVDEPNVDDFLASTGLATAALTANPTANKRYIVRHGAPQPVPASPLQGLTTRLFSLGGRLRVLAEPFLPARRDPADESLASFVQRRLGREMLDYAINPFVAGVYAGDPAQLSVRYAFPKVYNLEARYGSLIRGAFALQRARRRSGSTFKTRLVSFPGGLEHLVLHLASALGPRLRTRHRLTALQRTPAGWSAQVESPAGPAELAASQVILALDAATLADLPIDGQPDPGLASLAAIPYPYVTSVALGFPRSAVAHPLDGFGMLVPAREPAQILGTLFSSTLFPGRAPDGHVLLTSFVGGTRRPDLPGLPDAELVALVLADLARLLGVSGPPAFTQITRWPRAIPQYLVGYDRFLQAMSAAEQRHPGLHLAGHIRDGIALAKCLRGGLRVAAALAAPPAPASAAAPASRP